MPFPITPPARILEAMKAEAVAADIHIAFGEATPFNIRHERHRMSTRGEMPAVSLRAVNIEIDANRGGIHSHSEICWSMTVEIVVDMELPAEGSAGDDDPTGWNRVAATANAFANLFIAEGSPLLAIVDEIVPGDIDPDEDSQPDKARLAQSVVVLYRTLWNDQNHLLTSEENGL